MLRGSRVALLPKKSTQILLKIQTQPKWADKMLIIESKLATLKDKLSREKPPDHLASFVLGHIKDSLSNLEFPISDKKIAEILFKDFGQQPLQSLYYSLYDSLRLSRVGDCSVITAAVGLELAKLCGSRKSATRFTIDDKFTFEPSKDSDGPNPLTIALLAGRIDVAELIVKNEPRSYLDDMTVYIRAHGMPLSCDARQPALASRSVIYTQTQLISAFGDNEALRYLIPFSIRSKQKRYNKYDIEDACNRWTPLHFAAYFGKVDNMKLLIDEGKYDVNEETSDIFNPLHLALLSTEKSSFDAFSLLLERGANVNENVTLLHLAAEKDDIRFMEALLARDVDVKKLNYHTQQSPLHKAAKKGNVKALEALVARGSDINGLCRERKSPLHYALEGEHDAAAEFLITKGAKVTVADAKGRTPLNIAISNGSAHIVKLLLAKGVGIGSGDSYLVEAAKIGNVEVVEALIAAGASPCTEHKTPPWFVAAYYRKKEAFPILLAHSVASVSDVSLILKKKYSQELIPSTLRGGIPLLGTAFHWACLMGDVKSVTLFITMGANVNDTNCTRGRIPLHFAAEGNHANMIKLLISKGADIQAKDSYGWSPLHNAASYGKDEAIAALVDLGADLSVKTTSGKTPLVSYETYNYEKKSEIISLLTGKK